MPDELTEYILEARRKGHGDRFIREKLKSIGLTDEKINVAFINAYPKNEIIKQTAPMPQNSDVPTSKPDSNPSKQKMPGQPGLDSKDAKTKTANSLLNNRNVLLILGILSIVAILVFVGVLALIYQNLDYLTEAISGEPPGDEGILPQLDPTIHTTTTSITPAIDIEIQPHPCNLEESEILRNKCFYDEAKDTLDPQLCERIVKTLDTTYYNLCLTELSLLIRDESLCQYIDKEDMKMICIDQVMKAPEILDFVGDEPTSDELDRYELYVTRETVDVTINQEDLDIICQTDDNKPLGIGEYRFFGEPETFTPWFRSGSIKIKNNNGPPTVIEINKGEKLGLEVGVMFSIDYQQTRYSPTLTYDGLGRVHISDAISIYKNNPQKSILCAKETGYSLQTCRLSYLTTSILGVNTSGERGNYNKKYNLPPKSCLELCERVYPELLIDFPLNKYSIQGVCMEDDAVIRTYP